MTGPWQRGEFQLPDEHNERIFWSEIVPARLADLPSRSDPLAVVQIAQPGAGKSATGNYLGSYLGVDDYVVADSDLYKPYHPDYERLMREDDRAMTAATRIDGRIWMAKAQQYARDHQLDVLIDHTVDDLDYFRSTLEPYRAAGYGVVVYALAVPEALSRQGILDRYHQQREASGSGRLTIASKAAAAYRGVLDGAEVVEREGIADATVAVRRGLQVAYYNQRIGGNWLSEPRLREAVERERAQPLPDLERAGFLSRQAVLRTEVGSEFTSELDQIDVLAEPLLQERSTTLSMHPAPDVVFTRARSAGTELGRGRGGPDDDLGPTP